MCSDLNGTNCSVAIPSGPGVSDADYAVYISAKEFIGCRLGFLAFSQICHHERGLDRSD